MAYVKDLENIEYVGRIHFPRPSYWKTSPRSRLTPDVRSADLLIISSERLETFIWDVFHNFGELRTHHRRLLDQIFEIHTEEYPIIRNIAAPMYNMFLNFVDAYLKYVSNHPIVEYRIDEEMANNPLFKDFVEVSSPLPFIPVKFPISGVV